jgi:hypothetical protein
MRHFPLVSSVHTPSSVRWKRRLGLLEQYTCVQGGALSTVYFRKTMSVTSVGYHYSNLLLIFFSLGQD